MIIGNIINFIFALMGIAILTAIFLRVIINTYSKEKSIEAEVIDKNSYNKEIIRKNESSVKKKEYIITFLCKNKKKYFNVSELSYKNYKLKQKGILRYKGNKLIDFKERG